MENTRKQESSYALNNLQIDEEMTLEMGGDEGTIKQHFSRKLEWEMWKRVRNNI